MNSFVLLTARAHRDRLRARARRRRSFVVGHSALAASSLTELMFPLAVGHSSLAASSLNELLVAWSSPDVHSWDEMFELSAYFGDGGAGDYDDGDAGDAGGDDDYDDYDYDAGDDYYDAGAGDSVMRL
ncbi:unnamed protein product [Didymodactylos carnosus]|uniref:Uncharacterized protein n=1 Tax=Didymodactylos carnosus TaxID=1234261 RepID=A0A8S2XLW7_9BILA|nr:unnamed protein product [Didymodactylos carnosus]